MNKKLCIFMSVLAASAFTFALKAEAKGCCCITPSKKPQFYLDVGVGHAVDSQVGSAVILEPDGGGFVLDTLSGASHASPNNLLIGAGFLWSDLYQAQSPYFPFLSLGLQYQYTNFDSKKTLMQFTISNPNTSQVLASAKANYVFSENSLLGNLKLDLYRWGRMMPYLNLGLGASWNEAKDKEPFILIANDVDLVSATARNTAFSYTAGAGLDFLMTERFWLSLGYSYNNFGRINIHEFTNLDNPGPIDENHKLNLATHNIQLTGRYVFG